MKYYSPVRKDEIEMSVATGEFYVNYYCLEGKERENIYLGGFFKWSFSFVIQKETKQGHGQYWTVTKSWSLMP